MNTLNRFFFIGTLLLLVNHLIGVDLRHLVYMAFVMATNFVLQAWIKRQIRLASKETEARGRKHINRLQQWGRAISYGHLVAIVIIASSAIPDH